MIGYADDLVCCLAIELEIELGFRPTVFPTGETLYLAPPQRPFRGLDVFHRDADAGGLANDISLLRDRLSG